MSKVQSGVACGDLKSAEADKLRTRIRRSSEKMTRQFPFQCCFDVLRLILRPLSS